LNLAVIILFDTGVHSNRLLLALCESSIATPYLCSSSVPKYMNFSSL
jgi:hypothetical protein